VSKPPTPALKWAFDPTKPQFKRGPSHSLQRPDPTGKRAAGNSRWKRSGKVARSGGRRPGPADKIGAYVPLHCLGGDRYEERNDGAPSLR